MTVIRTADTKDLDEIHRINEDNLPHVNSVSTGWLREMTSAAAYFRVAEIEERVGAFLIGMTPGMDYQSPNYQWFSQRYDSFVYVDRIIVEARARRRGLGRALYDDLNQFSRPVAPVITCEVNLQPPNPGSIAFHEAFGFEQVGTQSTEGGRKQVALMEKRVGSVVGWSGGPPHQSPPVQ